MNTRQCLDLLRRYEARNVTFIEEDGSWPIIWERARGVYVWDAEGTKYLDLTAGFGVAAAGHANPQVVAAAQRQMNLLLHAMGDVHPHALKGQLARELSRITFERWAQGSRGWRVANSEPGTTDGSEQKTKPQNPKLETRNAKPCEAKTLFCNSGFEAVEAALKTALLATGKRGVIAFAGAYHGLGYGALNATHRDHFRGPFLSQLGAFGRFVPFPQAERWPRRPAATPRREASPTVDEVEARIRHVCQRQKIGAILVEPIQVRGGVRIPPPEFLPRLHGICQEHEALLILDEIYTGFGRTGKWFACEHSGVQPDILCLGKALTGGFPLSACVGRADLMDAAWPAATGEAIHTSTFLGHPVGCAMALAQIAEIRRLDLVNRSAKLGAVLLHLLQTQFSSPKRECASRGLGLLAGLEVRSPDGSPATRTAMRLIRAMLRRGFILLPEGDHANVISFTPPLTITRQQLEAAVKALTNVFPVDE